MIALPVRGPSIEVWANDQTFETLLVVGLTIVLVFAVLEFGVIMLGRLNSHAGLSGAGSDLASLVAYASAKEAHRLRAAKGTLRDTDGSPIDVWGWDREVMTAARHDAVQNRWDQWHTDLDLLIEFPAIHDVAHEDFAVRSLDAAEAAMKTRKRWENYRNDYTLLRDFETAVDAFDKALRDGEHQAKILGRGPSLDPVLRRVMDDAAHLVEILRRPDTTDGDRVRTMRALFKALKPIVGDHAVEIPELEPFVMKQLTISKTK